MKQTSANQKTAQRTPQAVDQTPSAGSKGMAIAPPAYGIDSVDLGLTEAQASRGAVTQRQADVANAGGDTGARAENKTGLPDNLKAGIESLSGLALENVRVHYNSSRPAQLQALAYTQGTEIHVAPGQERHLPHEAWHVVQQAQGRVQPTLQMKDGVVINDDQGLEREADVMGARALAEAQQYGASRAQEPCPGNFPPLQLTKTKWVVNRILAEKSGDSLYESNTASVEKHQQFLRTTTTADQPVAQRYTPVKNVEFVHEGKSDFELMKTFYLDKYSQIQIFLNDLGRIKPYLDELNEYLIRYDKSLSDMLALLMPQWSRTILTLVGIVPQRPFIAEMKAGKLFQDFVDLSPDIRMGFSHGGVSHRLQWYLISKQFPDDVLDLYKESFNPLWKFGEKGTMWDLIVDSGGHGHDFTAPGALWRYVYKEYESPFGTENRLKSNLTTELKEYDTKRKMLTDEQAAVRDAKREALNVPLHGTWPKLDENSHDVFEVWVVPSGNRWSGWRQDSVGKFWFPTIVQRPQSVDDEFETYSVPLLKAQ